MDRYAFSPEDVCDAGGDELRFYAMEEVGETIFKSYGHEGCKAVPASSEDMTIEQEGGDDWGEIDCGARFRGRCVVPGKEERNARQCTTEGGVKRGTVLQLMAKCHF